MGQQYHQPTIMSDETRALYDEAMGLMVKAQGMLLNARKRHEEEVSKRTAEVMAAK